MNNEDIEKAAEKYAGRHFLEEALTVINAPWPETVETYRRAFTCGARFALSHQWVRANERLPEDGELILIREYYRSARSGRFVNHIREFLYLEQYGFEFEEQANSNLKYRITHWMPIPQLTPKMKKDELTK